MEVMQKAKDNQIRRLNIHIGQENIKQTELQLFWEQCDIGRKRRKINTEKDPGSKEKTFTKIK